MPPTTTAATPQEPAGRSGRAERTLESVERDTIRRQGTRWINCHPDLPTGAKIVWQVIAEMTLGYRKEEDYLSHAVIADMSGMQTRAVSRAIHSLEDVGAIVYRQGYSDRATGRRSVSWVKVLRPWEEEGQTPVSTDGGTHNVVPLHPSDETGVTPVSTDTRGYAVMPLPPSDETGDPRLTGRGTPVSTDGGPPSGETGVPPSVETPFPLGTHEEVHEEVHEGAHEGGAASPRKVVASNLKRQGDDVAAPATTPSHNADTPRSQTTSPTRHLEAKTGAVENATPQSDAESVLGAFLEGARRASLTDQNVPPVLPPMGSNAATTRSMIEHALDEGAPAALVAVALAASIIREPGSERHDGWGSCRWLMDRLGSPRVTAEVRRIGLPVPSVDVAAEEALLTFARKRAGGGDARAASLERGLQAWLAEPTPGGSARA